MKLTIVINGAGGVGKDTMCEFAAEEYAVTNVSSIDPVKQAARILGWDAQKDLKSRKFLADMKQLCVEYNDWPTKYLAANSHIVSFPTPPAPFITIVSFTIISAPFQI